MAVQNNPHSHGWGETCTERCPAHPFFNPIHSAKTVADEPPPKPALRSYTSAERKAMPVHSGVLMYFPDALCAVARLSKAGNDKHNPGQPLHWARGKSTDHMDCLTRHTLTPGEVDPETGEIELVAAVWRSLAQLQLAEEARLCAAGIKPLSGIVP